MCKSPLSKFAHVGWEARMSRASASVKKSRRSRGVRIFPGGSSSHTRSCFAIKGPMPFSSVSERPAIRRSRACSGQRNALRAALLKARFRTPSWRSASCASSSASVALDNVSFKSPLPPKSGRGRPHFGEASVVIRLSQCRHWGGALVLSYRTNQSKQGRHSRKQLLRAARLAPSECHCRR